MHTHPASFLFKSIKCLSLSLILLLTTAAAVVAQSQITAGTIQGTALDANGAVVPGASVEIKNLDTNSTRTVTTDDNGRFVALALPPGNYSVTISKQGFATSVLERVTLTVGQALNVPVSMKVSSVEERVTITSTPTVDTARTEVSTTLDENAVSKTP